MGEQMARQLAAEGARTLVLVDRDAERLAEIAADLWASQGTNAAVSSATTVVTHVVDLADRTATVALAETILGAHPKVDLLVNNAGVALMGRFDEVSVEDVEWVLDINLRAPIILTRLLLPALKAAEGSHVINLSSLFGLIAPPGQVAYSTSKFGLRGFSEGIGVELARDGIGVTTVHPGGIATRIARSARAADSLSEHEVERGRAFADRLLRMDPAKAAAVILEAARRRRTRVVIGADAKALEWIPRVAPSRMRSLMRRAAKMR
jgi:short-subunit dehydrogenase